jgi:hypothetical protein
MRFTYTLDVETERALVRLARRLGLSNSEALRCAIRGIAGHIRCEAVDRLAALDHLQRSLALTRRKADAWVRRIRNGRASGPVLHKSRRR